MKNIFYVTGPCASGKSTFAKSLKDSIEIGACFDWDKAYHDIHSLSYTNIVFTSQNHDPRLEYMLFKISTDRNFNFFNIHLFIKEYKSFHKKKK